jgi:hypothetical protein
MPVLDLCYFVCIKFALCHYKQAYLRFASVNYFADDTHYWYALLSESLHTFVMQWHISHLFYVQEQVEKWKHEAMNWMPLSFNALTFIQTADWMPFNL